MKAEKRCPKCFIHKDRCFCQHIKKVCNQTKISILMHHREKFLATNTARLAKNVLENCELHMRGVKDSVLDLDLNSDDMTFYLYPSDDAILVDESFIQSLEGKKVHIIVPDGSWRQASKCKRREKQLEEIPSIKLPPKDSIIYRLRKQKYKEGMCTYEAISYLLGKIESPSVENHMNEILQVMNDQFKLARYY